MPLPRAGGFPVDKCEDVKECEGECEKVSMFLKEQKLQSYSSLYVTSVSSVEENNMEQNCTS